MSMTKDQAVRACKQGAYFGFVSFGVGLIFGLAAQLGSFGEDPPLGLWTELWAEFNDPLYFVDVFLVGIFAIGMLKISRVAAVAMSVYHVLSRVYFLTTVVPSLGDQTGVFIVVSLVFLFIYVRAVFGAFIFHSLEKKENPDHRPVSKWMYWLGIPVGVLVSFLVVLGTLTTTGVLPSTQVLSGEEMPSTEVATLRNIGIIDSDEELIYFYSEDIWSVANAGNVLTDDRVITYFEDQLGELAIYELYLDEISSVRLEQPGGFFNDSVYRVIGHDPDVWFELFLSTELGGDVLFAEEIRSRIK